MNKENNLLDELVCFSYAMRKEYPRLLELAAYDQLTDGNIVWPYHAIMKISGQSEDVCLELCEQAEAKGLIEYGTTIKGGWLTEQGEKIFQTSGLKFSDFFDKAFEEGIPHESIHQWPESKKAELIEEMDRLDAMEEPEPTKSNINPDFGQSHSPDDDPGPKNRSTLH